MEAVAEKYLQGRGPVGLARPAVAFAALGVAVSGVRRLREVRRAQSAKSARFRSLIDKAWDLIVVLESDLSVAFATSSWTRILDRQISEVLATSLSDHIEADDVEEVTERITALAPGESAWFEARMGRPDGSTRRVSWNAVNLLDDPSVGGYVLNGTDVTELRESAAELVSARDEAMAASRAKSQFLATMSHEIRTPMNGVIGLTELLLDTALDPDQKELASGVKVSAENLLVIINDILDFSKIEAGKMALEELPIDLHDLFDEVGRMLAGSAHSKGLELLVDIESAVPRAVVGDKVRLEQILLNFGSNAVKFSPSGEVVIRARLLHASPDRAAVRFEVTDNGIGIAEDVQTRLFQAFTQADSSTTRRFGGTGLGLAICRQLVGLMDGRIGVNSREGEGSTFWFEVSFRLPDSGPTGGASGEPSSLNGRRALVVDDNATNRLILKRLLASWGVDATEVADGAAALAEAATAVADGQPFDFGIIDLNMPGMDGVELATRLKASSDASATTLFLLSSSGDRLLGGPHHPSEFAATLAKPVRSSELFECLTTHAGRVRPATLPDEGVEPQGKGGAVLLLVEDNRMNQLVATKILDKLGHRYQVVDDGAKAFAAVTAGTFDAVLMDCEMPNVDGYEATGLIRRSEAHGARIPIIAMTAAAMAGDRERCLAAGMDDYITKPIRADVLALTLAKWLPEADSSGPGGPVEATPITLDPAQLAALIDLDDGEGSVLAEIANEFLAEAPGIRDDVWRSADDGDAESMTRSSHTLKGAAANIGAVALVAALAGIEENGRRGDCAAARSQLDALDECLDATMTAIRPYSEGLTCVS